MAYFVESADRSSDRVNPLHENATVTVLAGTHSHSQGHETVYAQMVSEWLGVDFTTIRMIQAIPTG